MKPSIGHVPGTRQESVEYAKKATAKCTVEEAKALADAAGNTAVLVSRFALLIAGAGVVLSLVALAVAVLR